MEDYAAVKLCPNTSEFMDPLVMVSAALVSTLTPSPKS